MKCPYAFVVFLLMGGTALGGPVTLVATWDFGNSFSTPQVVESARPVLFYLGPNNEIWSPLFEDFSPPREYPANLTETVWTSNDPDFSSFASRLTNGTNDELGVLAWADQGPIGGGGGTESDLLLLVPRLGPDLVGYEINHITEVLAIDLQTPGSDPFGDGVNTDLLPKT